MLELRLMGLAISVGLLLSGCFPAPSQHPEKDAPTAPSALDSSDFESRKDGAAFPTESCGTLKELSFDLSGRGGHLDQDRLLAWVTGMKNRFSRDEQGSITSELESFRMTFGLLYELVVKYFPEAGSENWAPPEAYTELTDSLEATRTSLNALSQRCRDDFQLPEFELAELRLGDFWKYGFWSVLEEENSLGEVTVSASNSARGGPYSFSLNLYCYEWFLPHALVLQMSVNIDGREVDITDYGLGGVKVRLDDEAVQTWVGEFNGGYFYVGGNRSQHADLRQLRGKSNFATQVKVSNALVDTAIDISGIDPVLDRLAESGCTR